MNETLKTYVCSDKDATTPIEDLFVFRIEPHRKFSVTSNPTEKGVARQDNKIRHPMTVSVTAFAYRTFVRQMDGIPLGRDWEYFFTNDPYALFSAKDNGKTYLNLTVESVKVTHDSEMPDLLSVNIEFTELLDADEFKKDEAES